MDNIDPCLLPLCIIFKGLLESGIKLLISEADLANHKILEPIHA